MRLADMIFVAVKLRKTAKMIPTVKGYLAATYGGRVRMVDNRIFEPTKMIWGAYCI